MGRKKSDAGSVLTAGADCSDVAAVCPGCVCAGWAGFADEDMAGLAAEGMAGFADEGMAGCPGSGLL